MCGVNEGTRLMRMIELEDIEVDMSPHGLPNGGIQANNDSPVLKKSADI